MSNSVIERINNQIKQVVPQSIPTEVVAPEPEKPSIQNPLSSEEIRQIFLIEEEKIIEKQDVVFSDIESFVSWYQANQAAFSESQRTALNSLIEMRNYINSGCSCKRDYRLGQANNYYRDFWMQNASTDLPQKVKDVGNFNSVFFKLRELEIVKV